MNLPQIIKPKRHADERGWFSETFREARLREIGINCRFVQDNQVYSKKAGTLRGLHFQVPPAPQAKLIAVLRGHILDVAIDIRHNSPTYGEFISKELSSDSGLLMYIPVGFAHGYLTLEDDVTVQYKVSIITRLRTIAEFAGTIRTLPFHGHWQAPTSSYRTRTGDFRCSRNLPVRSPMMAIRSVRWWSGPCKWRRGIQYEDRRHRRSGLHRIGPGQTSHRPYRSRGACRRQVDLCRQSRLAGFGRRAIRAIASAAPISAIVRPSPKFFRASIPTR